MFKNIYVLPIAVALMFVPTYIERADAIPLMPHGLSVAAPPSDAQPVYYRGAYRGGAYRGGVYRGGVYRGGAYRVGGRYYGGYWYGPGRRWYGGRWWPYGVGSCWRASPIGYVWVCG
jgi:hypothetical protein